MKNKHYVWVWFLVSVAVIAVVFSAVVVVARRLGKSNSVERSQSSPAVKPNVVTVASSGEKIIENKAAGYSFVMPAQWYLEKNADISAATVYPDYNPHAAPSVPPACKIELSRFTVPTDSADFNLDDWITAHLHEDPTVDATEIARMAVEIGGELGVEWQGILNGATTTLDYAVAPSDAGSPREVFEIVPSSLLPAGADHKDCTAYLQEMVSTFKFGNDANR